MKTATSGHKEPKEKQTFGKHERLCSEKVMGHIFDNGQKLYHFPFRLLYQLDDYSGSAVKVMISVPKRSFKRAVKRNLLKRRIREAYRRNKQGLYACIPENKTLNLILIYIAPQINTYWQIESRLTQALGKLENDIKKGIDTTLVTAD